jgi:hypothetical protein
VKVWLGTDTFQLGGVIHTRLQECGQLFKLLLLLVKLRTLDPNCGLH